MPVPAAIISLQSLPDSALLQTALSDSTGTYELNAVQTARTFISVSAPGYRVQQVAIEDTGIKRLTRNFLLQKSAASLAGITVSSSKPIIERRVDRTIYNIANSAIAAGSDALEAVKKLPGVRVTQSDISVAGKSMVNVLVDDKLVQLSGDELLSLLRSIPADNIARLELITTPPAKYDAAGSSGLINIVMKKQLRNGFNGNLNLSYTQRTRGGGGGNGSFNYRKDKLNIYGIGNAYNAYQQPDENITSFYTAQRLELHRDAEHNSIFNRGQLGIDYNLTPTSVIGVLYTAGNGGPEYNGHEYITAPIYNTATGRPDSIIITKAYKRERGVRNVGNVNYEWKIDTSGKKLSIDLDYFHRTGRGFREFTTQSFYENGTPVSDAGSNHISGIQTVKVAAAKADVAWPSSLANFSFGGKASLVHNISNNLYEHLQDSAYITDPGKTNDFDYRETIGALYFSAQRTFEKWEVQLGLRGEYTDAKGYSPTLGQTNTNRYFKIFPTAYIQYRPGEDHTFNITYSKRIDRPDFWITNPFRNYTTANTYEEGNPFLQPAFINIVELSYGYQSKYSFKFYAEAINNLVTRVSRADSAHNIFYFTSANVGSVRNYGFSANASIEPFKWWECTLGGNAWYSVFRSAYYDGADGAAYSRPGATLSTSNNFTLNKGKTLLAEVNFEYNTAQLSDFDIAQSNSDLSAGIKVLLLQKQLTLGIGVSDILSTDRFRMRNLYNGTTQDSYYDERLIRFTVGLNLATRASGKNVSTIPQAMTIAG